MFKNLEVSSGKLYGYRFLLFFFPRSLRVLGSQLPLNFSRISAANFFVFKKDCPGITAWDASAIFVIRKVEEIGLSKRLICCSVS